MGKTGQTKEYSSLDIGYFLLFLAFIASKKLTYMIISCLILHRWQRLYLCFFLQLIIDKSKCKLIYYNQMISYVIIIFW